MAFNFFVVKDRNGKEIAHWVSDKNVEDLLKSNEIKKLNVKIHVYNSQKYFTKYKRNRRYEK